MATCTDTPADVNRNMLSSIDFREVTAPLDNYPQPMGWGGFIYPVSLHWYHGSSVILRQFAVAVSNFGAQSNLSYPASGRLFRSFSLDLH